MTSLANPTPDPSRRFVAWLAALFLTVLGAKLWAIAAFGTGIPFCDQWGEADEFFRPWLEGHLTVHDWFAAHNEHRILFTRLLDLFILRWNGQWDPLLQMTVNALIHAGYACGLAAGLWFWTGKKRPGLICGALAPFFAFPLGAENIIHGFQSQMYFLSLFAVATIAGLGLGRPGKIGWLGGLVAAVLSIFTMGSGLLAALAVAALMVMRMLKDRSATPPHLLTLGCGLGIFAAGLFLNATAPVNQVFRAGTPLIFVDALLRNLAWPFLELPVLMFLMCLPLAIVGFRYFRRETKTPAAEFLLAFGLWGFLQAAALAFSRAGLCGTSRYADTLATLALANLGSLFVIANDGGFHRIPQRIASLLAVAWVAVCAWGMWQNCEPLLGDYRGVENYFQRSRQLGLIETENVRAFVATDDAGHLLNQPPWQIPDWNAPRMVALLRQPQLLDLMPAEIRRPLKLEPDPHADGPFGLNACAPANPPLKFTRVWGSFNAMGAADTGRFVSQPLRARLPKLEVQVCCGGELNNLSARLVEIATGNITGIAPSRTNQWETVCVSAPHSPFRLEITDQNTHSWIAAGEIKELGGLSFHSRWLMVKWRFILLGGLCLFVLLSGANLIRRRPESVTEWLPDLILLAAMIIALGSVWNARNFDETQLTVKLHRNCAAQLAARGDSAGAKQQLRLALWLQPADVAARNQLRALEAHPAGDGEPHH